jgi:hypothetical protein
MKKFVLILFFLLMTASRISYSEEVPDFFQNDQENILKTMKAAREKIVGMPLLDGTSVLSDRKQVYRHPREMTSAETEGR